MIYWNNEGKIKYLGNHSKAITQKYLKELGVSLIIKSIDLVSNGEVIFCKISCSYLKAYYGNEEVKYILDIW